MYTSLFVTDDDVRRFSKETALNIGLSHPNIVRFYGLCVVPPAICLVFEYCEWGSLELVLMAQRPHGRATEWDLATKLKACLDACRAVAYLHSFNPPLLHRDIKTANFLLASDATLKLSDFGESNLMRPKNDGTMTIVGSVDFMAPEMISGGRPTSAVYGTAADVYSLTMTLWHIFVPGRNPWKGRSHFEVYTKTIQGHRPPIPDTLPIECQELLRHGWTPDPDDRWPVDEMPCT
ncbi:protein kinase [Achlya hypogyna]|uniref:Protein kinase n=1 Tax=Achlya hypogyna TaxID=1202772 RepID=A0A1V9YVI7_ACHHY|nr:protein kinase [Achlya hypogyna]